MCVFGESIFDEFFCFVVRAVIEESLLSIQRGQASNNFFLGFNFFNCFVLGEQRWASNHSQLTLLTRFNARR